MWLRSSRLFLAAFVSSAGVHSCNTESDRRVPPGVGSLSSVHCLCVPRGVSTPDGTGSRGRPRVIANGRRICEKENPLLARFRFLARLAGVVTHVSAALVRAARQLSLQHPNVLMLQLFFAQPIT